MRLNQQTYMGWGRVLRAEAQVARPERHGHLADMIAQSPHILAHGALRSYGDAPLSAEGLALSTARLDRLLGFDPATKVLEAEAGVALGEILRVFAIANDVHGKNHHIAGSFGQHIEAISLIDANGKQIWVSSTQNEALFKATIGGVGQTGLITAAKLRLVPCPAQTMVVAETRIDNLEAFLARFETEAAPFQVGWIDALAQGPSLGRGIFEAAHAPMVRAFNAVYRARVPHGGRIITRGLHRFFFPLDRITNWNLAYGKSGFHQFQAIIPMENAQHNLRAMLQSVAKGRLASPLAVIKKTGPGRAGYLSFPMEGISLALDIPNRKGAEATLAELERLTLEAGGRIYLAKDSAAAPASIEAMYPELPAFRAALKQHDPTGKFTSALAKRLNLRGHA